MSNQFIWIGKKMRFINNLNCTIFSIIDNKDSYLCSEDMNKFYNINYIIYKFYKWEKILVCICQIKNL